MRKYYVESKRHVSKSLRRILVFFYWPFLDKHDAEQTRQEFALLYSKLTTLFRSGCFLKSWNNLKRLGINSGYYTCKCKQKQRAQEIWNDAYSFAMRVAAAMNFFASNGRANIAFFCVEPVLCLILEICRLTYINYCITSCCLHPTTVEV